MAVRNFVRQHYEKAKQKGWLPYFAQAALKYDFPLALLLAIASRETNMSNIKGDFRKSKHFPNGGYHGYGIMQVDVGTDAAWIATGNWQKVNEAIMHGAKILDSKRDELNRTWQGSRTLQQFLWTLAASYNHGSKGSYKDFKEAGNPDKHTTGHDYGRDVLGRMVEFSSMLAADGITATSYALKGVADLAVSQPPPSVTDQNTAAPGVGTGSTIIQTGEENTVNTDNTPVQGGSKDDKPKDLPTTAPVKSGGLKATVAAIGASIWAAIQFFGIEIREAFGTAKESMSDSPLGTVSVICFTVAGLVIYWKYQERQTKLDLQREQNAHDRDLANQQVLADPKKINVAITPPVPAAQEPAAVQEAAATNSITP